MVILDTNVLSELRLTDCSPAVLAFIADTAADHLAIAAASVSEIAYGAELLARRGAAMADAITAWLDALIATYRVLPMDASAARRLGHMLAIPALHGLALTHPGARRPKFGADLAIAAVAVANKAAVATRNTRDFALIAQHCPGLRVIDPFQPRTG